MNFKYGKRKALWDFIDLNLARLYKAKSILLWHVKERGNFCTHLKEKMGIDSVEIFNFRGWHEGTSTFLGIDKDGNKIFIKRSEFPEFVDAEIASIDYLDITCRDYPVHTCKVIGSGVFKKYGFVIESYIEGTSLKSLMDQNLEESYKSELILELYKIITQLREAAFIHGDFTPQNILVHDNKLYLIDFEYSLIMKQGYENYRVKTAKKRKMIHLGGEYAMENGVIDDAFSLVQIVRNFYPEFAVIHPQEWINMNLDIGKLQFDMRSL